MTPVINVDRISKVYRLYHRHADRLKEALDPRRKKYHQDFYALKDVTFAVQRGETIGIIGKNGSGKSTLLKIITGILTPSAGAVHRQGKVSALLELGAGFNPELTGIENIYFSGTIMGYTRREMDARLDAIAAFADIADYLDQPVKTYSSGMFVRLAFAVAINVDPDILVVDEALAVGDISFQAKCFRKLNEFRAQGKTVLFVTHSLDSVIRYCSRTLVLDKGRIIAAADPKKAVDVYKQLLAESEAPPAQTGVRAQPFPTGALAEKLIVDSNALSYGNRKAEITDCGLFDEQLQPTQLLHHGRPFTIRMKIVFHDCVTDPIFAYTLKDLKGLEVTGTNTLFKQVPTGSYGPGDTVQVEFAQVMNGRSDRYSLSLGCTGYERDAFVVYHRLYDALLFEVVSPLQIVGFYDLESKITIQPVAD